ncbi:PHP domain-containing protein [Nocardia gipuzkoensis]
MALPADSHVHSEWSWDTGGPTSGAAGRMEQTCERAIAIGLPAMIFTEHLDFDTDWRTTTEDLMPHQRRLLDPDGYLRPPRFDVAGYLDCIERCRHQFPDLRILTGVEFGQQHRFEEQAAQLLDLAMLDRVNGSLHTLPIDDDRSEPNTLFRLWPAEKVMWAYLEEIRRVVAGSEAFAVFCHIDYAVRAWPTATSGPFDPHRFEEGFRTAMRAIADSGRALEMNTRHLRPWIPQWWAEEGGRAVTFGSDAHVPEALADNFPEAVAMIEHFGFRPGRRPEDFWTR